MADFIEKCDLNGKVVIPFATYGMSGINWTMKHLTQVCAGAEIRLPFDSGSFKKGNYAEWMKQVQAVCQEG